MSDADDAEIVDHNDDEPIIKGTDDALPSQATTRDVDWPALWHEFGFDSEDASGHVYASSLQLETAVAVSDQHIAGDAQSHIDDAVDDGTLHELTNPDRGYVLEGGVEQ
jgi:hypothetical protein